ncbi:hypothetical protein I4U23_010287 [Adineta vaga]|nr:hypothetical protein I4U23_010287 [Adineta vaga]
MADGYSDDFTDRDMREYKLRTAYGGLLKKSRRKPSKYNDVQVAHSDGCCSSQDSMNHTSHKHKHTPRHEAHERSHHKLGPNEPVYVQHGRVTKNYNRPKKSNEQFHSTGQTTSTKSVPATKQKGCCCCCTIC